MPAQWTGTIAGANPGFAGAAALQLRPTAASPLRNAGTSVPAGPPGFPFPAPQFPPAWEPPDRAVLPGSPPPRRILLGPIDVGAFEWPGALFTDGLENGSTSRWSAAQP